MIIEAIKSVSLLQTSLFRIDRVKRLLSIIEIISLCLTFECLILTGVIPRSTDGVFWGLGLDTEKCLGDVHIVLQVIA